MKLISVAALAASAVFLSGCSENPAAPSSVDPVGGNALVTASRSTAPGAGGMAGQVTQLRSVVDTLGALFEVQPTPTSYGIPQQLAAVGLQVGVIAVALETQVAQMNAAITAGTATPEQVEQFIKKMQSATNYVYRVNGLIVIDQVITIGDSFSMQMLMNQLSQMSAMSTSVVASLNQVLIDMGRPPKGA